MDGSSVPGALDGTYSMERTRYLMLVQTTRRLLLDTVGHRGNHRASGAIEHR
jgi:hypothetical protein